MPIWNPDEEVLKQTAKAVKAGEEVELFDQGECFDRGKCFDLCQLYMGGIMLSSWGRSGCVSA